MGGAKTRMMENMEERNDRWNALANAKHWICENCCMPIPFEERDIYFETKWCGHCVHMIEKLYRD